MVEMDLEPISCPFSAVIVATSGLQDEFVLALRVRALQLLLPGCTSPERGQNLGLQAGRSAVKTDLVWHLEKKYNQQECLKELVVVPPPPGSPL